MEEEINIDLIRSLRLCDRHEEAYELLCNWRREWEKKKELIYLEETKNLRIQKNIEGYCANFYCKRKAVNGQRLCLKCRTIQREGNIRYRIKKKCGGVKNGRNGSDKEPL